MFLELKSFEAPYKAKLTIVSSCELFNVYPDNSGASKLAVRTPSFRKSMLATRKSRILKYIFYVSNKYIIVV